jgi:Zn-dependent M28 family amino/carboxypeptidase
MHTHSTHPCFLHTHGRAPVQAVALLLKQVVCGDEGLLQVHLHISAAARRAAHCGAHAAAATGSTQYNATHAAIHTRARARTHVVKTHARLLCGRAGGA